MACTYIFNGHKFNSEIELDSFLLEKYKDYQKYGDIVFLQTPSQTNAIGRLKILKEEALKHWDTYLELLNNPDYKIYDPDGEIEAYNGIYSGVNTLLTKERGLTGKRLHMEFIDKNYWRETFERWKQGIFDEVVQELKGWKENDTALTEEECNNLKEEILERWEYLSKIGTAIHKALLIFFSRATDKNSKEKKYVFELDNPAEEIHKRFKHFKNINTGKRLYSDEEYNFIKDKIDDIVAYGNKLKDNIKSQIPKSENLLFFTEFRAWADVDSEYAKTVLGEIDLIIVDDTGTVHILDYKTSIKDYAYFEQSGKTLTYKNLLAMYNRMLQRRGISVFGGQLFIAPIRIDGFEKSGKTFKFDSLNGDNLAVNFTESGMEPIFANINKFLPIKLTFTLDLDDCIAKTDKDMKECFKDYKATKNITEENTKEFLEEEGYLKKDSKGNFVYKVGSDTIESADEVDFIKRVAGYMQEKQNTRIRLTGNLMNLLSKAIEEGSVDSINIGANHDSGISITWLKDTFKKYVNGLWKLVENKDTKFLSETYGIIILENESTGTLDILRVSTSYVDSNYRKYKKNRVNNRARSGITGDFETDSQANSKSGTLMLESANGNVELMELMFVLNNSNLHLNESSEKKYKIGEMSVILPYHRKKIAPTEKELLYTFNELAKFRPPSWNRFEKNATDTEPEIQFKNAFERALASYTEILNYHLLSSKENNYFTIFNGCTSVLDDVSEKNPEEKIKALSKLLTILETNERNKGSNEYDKIYRTQGELQQDHIRLRNDIISAINVLRGINFRQLLKDHGDWYQSLMIWRNGLQGNRIDNPGNLSSETLNLITTAIKLAYQNTRDEVLRFKSELDELVLAVKEELGFGYIQENLGFNQVDLYKDLFEERNGDLFFVHPSKTVGAKARLLEFTLEKINKDRFGEATAKRLKEEDDESYYRVPLALGSKDSVASVKGWLGALKNRFKSFAPKLLQEQYLKKIQGLEYDDDVEETPDFVFKMTNMFDRGNENKTTLDTRLKLIRDNGIENMERNVETLLLKHVFAYAQLRNIDEVFPLMKGAAIHLLQQGANLNKYFEKDLNYFKDYVWAKVFNKSLVPKDLRHVLRMLNFLKQGATRFALAFSPVQMLYQSIQGLWQYASLALRNPGYNKAFTFNNFRKAFGIVYRDLFNFSGKPTVCSRLNELYGINDMDMNSFIERIAKNKKGIYNLDGLAMKFSARPDYYNRMIILVSQMLADGSFYAHSINSKGELVYDWTKDKRFERYANNDTSDMTEYNKQKALYYAIATQMLNEGTKMIDENGKEVPFSFDITKNPTALPRAYSVKELNGMKSLADDIYGYYSHEDKSLMMSSIVGSMWLQFKTYWSGKKNIYLQGGGIRQRGHWEFVTETNHEGEQVLWYYKVNDDGTVDYETMIPDKKPNANYNGFLADTASKQIAPVVRWKGLWLEGVIVSIAQIFGDKNIVQNFQNAWNNEDPDLQKAFLNNVKQIGFDLFMFFVVGSILGSWMALSLKDFEDDNKEYEDLLTALELSAARISVMSVKNSFADLNFFNSIGSPITNWTPFAFDYWGRIAGRYFDAAIGEKNWFDTIVSNYAVGNQMKPLFNLLKPESMKSKREGGTWESRSARQNRERKEGKA